MKQPSIWVRVTKQVEAGPREGDIEPVVWMSRASEPERSGSKLISLLANFNGDTNFSVQIADRTVKELAVLLAITSSSRLRAAVRSAPVKSAAFSSRNGFARKSASNSASPLSLIWSG